MHKTSRLKDNKCGVGGGGGRAGARGGGGVNIPNIFWI